MIVNVMYQHDRVAHYVAANRTRMMGRNVELKHNFSTLDLSQEIRRAISNELGTLSVLRFIRIPFEEIFNLQVDSPLTGNSTRRETTPEEEHLQSLNECFVPGRGQVYFVGCNVDLSTSFLRNPNLRHKLWPRVADYAAYNVSPGERVSEIVSGR